MNVDSCLLCIVAVMQSGWLSSSPLCLSWLPSSSACYCASVATEEAEAQ